MAGKEMAALIVAAGEAGAFSPMGKVGRISSVQRLIIVFRQAGIRNIVLAVGGDAAKLEKHVSRMGVVCLAQEAGAQMLDCVKAGLSYLRGKCGGVLVTPADVPLFSVETVRALAEPGAELVVPVCRGKAGHPLLVGARLFPAVLRYTGENGLAGAVRAAGVPRTEIPVADEGVLLNVKKTKEFEALVEQHCLRSLRPEVKIRLAREEAFYGPGTQQLLTLLGDTGSVRLACKRMGISYSKGWNMIAAMERQLGYEVVERRQGGKDGGRSVITKKGAALMKRYAAFESECGERVREAFEKHFGKGINCL